MEANRHLALILLIALAYPVVAQHPMTHVLENAFLRIGFDGQGRVREMVNKATDTHYVHPGPLSSVTFGKDEPAPPFTVYAYPADGPFHFKDYEEEQFAGFSTALPELVDEKTFAGRKWLFQYYVCRLRLASPHIHLQADGRTFRQAQWSVINDVVVIEPGIGFEDQRYSHSKRRAQNT